MLRKPSSPKGSPIFALTVVLSPSPSEYSPVFIDKLPPELFSFRMKLITPAIASEPYCAEAPSLKTSMLPIAEDGIVCKSAFCVPLPPMATSDARWRRFELTNTRVLSVGRPRSCAGLINVAPSDIGCRAKLNEGTNVLRMSFVSVKDTSSRS